MKIVDVIWRKPVSTYAISACEALVASVNFGCPTLCPVCSWKHWLTQLWRQILVVCSKTWPLSCWGSSGAVLGGSSWFLACSSYLLCCICRYEMWRNIKKEVSCSLIGVTCNAYPGLPGSEKSTDNFCSRETFVPHNFRSQYRERKFRELMLHGTFAPVELSILTYYTRDSTNYMPLLCILSTITGVKEKLVLHEFCSRSAPKLVCQVVTFEASLTLAWKMVYAMACNLR